MLSRERQQMRQYWEIAKTKEGRRILRLLDYVDDLEKRLELSSKERDVLRLEFDELRREFDKRYRQRLRL